MLFARMLMIVIHIFYMRKLMNELLVSIKFTNEVERTRILSMKGIINKNIVKGQLILKWTLEDLYV